MLGRNLTLKISVAPMPSGCGCLDLGPLLTPAAGGVDATRLPGLASLYFTPPFPSAAEAEGPSVSRRSTVLGRGRPPPTIMGYGVHPLQELSPDKTYPNGTRLIV